MSEPLGIIYPPPELRGIVDSTAKYVAKNGGAFEERIKREHRDKPKFSFLLSDDPFHAYYQHKVKEIRDQLLGSLDSKTESSETVPVKPEKDVTNTQAANSRHDQASPRADSDQVNNNQIVSTETCNDQGPSQAAGGDIDECGQPRPDDELPTTSNGESGPRVRFKLNEYMEELTKKIEEPPKLNFLASSTPTSSNIDCDVIKLVSQFASAYGRSFLVDLVGREQDNSQFDFLKPQHGQFQYMTDLVMQYTLIRNQNSDILEQLDKDSTSQKHVLDKFKMRAEWNRMLEQEQKKREEAAEREKLLYSQIDWHDFVIVETIDYQPNERGEYPPTTAEDVGTRILQQQRFEEQSAPEEMDIDMEMESNSGSESDREEARAETGSFAVPDSLPLKPDKVLIRKDYDPKAASKTVSQPDNYFVSPITNERIPVDKIHEHVKYNLADPRYLEKKSQMMQEKMNEETVFASGSQIQSSLKSLAERRTDIFGMNDKEAAIGRRIGDEEQTKTKDDRLIWDGHKSSLKKKKLGN